MSTISDQRKHARVENSYVTRFRIKSKQDIIYNLWNIVTATNLSAGGTFFYAIGNLEVGTIIDLKICFYPVHPSIICIGKVIRAKRHMDTSIVGFGIQFSEINKTILNLLN